MSLKSMPLYITFWREFYERPVTIFFMVSGEGMHHYRDAVSLTEISRAFPHGLTQVRFCPVVPSVTEVESPAPGEGIIILGRPWLFRSELIQKWTNECLFPPLQFRFDSNDPQEQGYRTPRCLLTDETYITPNRPEGLFQPLLEDYALICLGRVQVYENEQASPCLILSGTSTLGTWGASVFVTSPNLLETHVGYSPWFQGVLSSALKLPAPGAPFQRHNLTLHVTNSFFRACWVKVIYDGQAVEKEWRRKVNFKIFADDRMIVATGHDNWRCFISLALEQRDRPGQFIHVREVEARLRQAFTPPTSVNVPARLNDVAEQLRRHGVYIEKAPTGYHLLLAGFEEEVV